MTPPAGPGQLKVLNTHYNQIDQGPVAYLDETYHVENDGRVRFYVMSAVVVLGQDRNAMRDELDDRVPEGWWHTTDQLRTEEGRNHTQGLLETFRVPDETCVVVHKTAVDDADTDGQQARREVLKRLITDVHRPAAGTHPPVNLIVLEEQREASKNNFDRSVRAELLRSSEVSPTLKLVLASPGSEHLLWLPDLVCSAYRQQTVFNQTRLFKTISHLTRVVHVP